MTGLDHIFLDFLKLSITFISIYNDENSFLTLLTCPHSVLLCTMDTITLEPRPVSSPALLWPSPAAGAYLFCPPLTCKLVYYMLHNGPVLTLE